MNKYFMFCVISLTHEMFIWWHCLFMITTLKMELFVVTRTTAESLERNEVKHMLYSVKKSSYSKLSIKVILRAYVTLIGRVYTNKTNIFNCAVSVTEIWTALL